MHVIAVLNQKGGVGKSTLATNLARALQLQDLRVAIIDTDPQGTAQDWDATSDVGPAVYGVAGARRLNGNVRKLRDSFDVIVIDGAAKAESMSTQAVKTSDLVLIPVQPSAADLWSVGDLVSLIQTRQEVTEGSPKAAFVISRQVVGTRLASDVAEALEAFELPTLEGRTSQRVAYTEAMGAGSSVLDTQPSGKAANEIEAITDEVKQLLDIP